MGCLPLILPQNLINENDTRTQRAERSGLNILFSLEDEPVNEIVSAVRLVHVSFKGNDHRPSLRVAGDGLDGTAARLRLLT